MFGKCRAHLGIEPSWKPHVTTLLRKLVSIPLNIKVAVSACLRPHQYTTMYISVPLGTWGVFCSIKRFHTAAGNQLYIVLSQILFFLVIKRHSL